MSYSNRKALFEMTGILTGVASLSIPLSALFSMQSIVNAAEACIPLRVVGSQTETIARKRIELRLVNAGNANVDFAVPTGYRFSRYIATLTPENEAGYKVSVNLKFNDDTSKLVYGEKDLPLKRDVPYQLSIPTPPGLTRQPYQVNLHITGANGNVYRAKVSACYNR